MKYKAWNRERWLTVLTICILMAVVLAGSATSRLVPIPCLSGFVRDTGGSPVADADLDFTDSVTGVRLITPGDNTDGTGFYNVCVLPGVYDVSFAPPAGTRLMGKLIRNVDLTSDQGQELDVVLAFGTVVSGTVTGSDGLAVGDVDIDVDAVGGGRIFTPDDNSDPVTGFYRVVIPDGLHRFRFEPPLGSRWRGVEIDSVTVTGDLDLDVTLSEGVLLSGRVSETGGSGLFDVDVDLRDAITGAKIFVANNSSDEAGDYTIAVPTGTVQLRFVPPRGSHHIAELIENFEITGDQIWNEDLEPGLLVSVVARDLAGAPVPGADLDIKIAATGEKFFTPHDRTDAQGISPAALPAGTYTIQVDPPLGTIFDRAVLESVTVANDTTIVVELQEVPRTTARGRVVDTAGTGLAGVHFDARLLPDGTAVYIPVDATDADGNFELALPRGTYDIFVVPPRGTRLVGARLENVSALSDSSWGELVLTDGWLVNVTVRNNLGQPVAGADLDLLIPATNQEIFTPHDNTDAAGQVTVAVPGGVYHLTINPPADTRLQALTIENFEITSDTVASFDLESLTPDIQGPLYLAPNQPNPFNAETTIIFTLAAPAEINLSIFDLKGRLVRVLEQGSFSPATITTSWDGKDGSGSQVASGTYFVQVKTSIGTETRKMSLVR